MEKMKKVSIPGYMKTSYRPDHQADWAITYEAVKKMEAFAREVLPPGSMERFEADARAFGINAELYMLSQCGDLVCDVVRTFDLSESDEIRKCSAPKRNGAIYRRNCQPEPFWRKSDMTPAREKKIRAIREHNRNLAKAA
jgi:hypothetical protein